MVYGTPTGGSPQTQGDDGAYLILLDGDIYGSYDGAHGFVDRRSYGKYSICLYIIRIAKYNLIFS